MEEGGIIRAEGARVGGRACKLARKRSLGEIKSPRLRCFWASTRSGAKLPTRRSEHRMSGLRVSRGGLDVREGAVRGGVAEPAMQRVRGGVLDLPAV
jgi:hypothetical protein